MSSTEAGRHEDAAKSIRPLICRNSQTLHLLFDCDTKIIELDLCFQPNLNKCIPRTMQNELFYVETNEGKRQQQ